MMGESLALMALGFTLGLIHALDADHVMAVSAMNNTRSGWINAVVVSSQWALGHGGVLLASGLLLFGLGIGIPESLALIAERLIGVFLIGMGILCFWRFRIERIALTEHHHGDLKHLHWHVEGDERHADVSDHSRKQAHTPVLVGALHGLAGTAPALALVPVAMQTSPLIAVGYLSLFSVGVMLAMLTFGLGFGVTQRFLRQKYLILFNIFRNSVAVCSILFGGYWLSQGL